MPQSIYQLCSEAQLLLQVSLQIMNMLLYRKDCLHVTLGCSGHQIDKIMMPLEHKHLDFQATDLTYTSTKHKSLAVCVHALHTNRMML